MMHTLCKLEHVSLLVGDFISLVQDRNDIELCFHFKALYLKTRQANGLLQIVLDNQKVIDHWSPHNHWSLYAFLE